MNRDSHLATEGEWALRWQRALLNRIFWLTVFVHGVAVIVLNVSGALDGGISRDSIKYHELGQQIAVRYSLGQIEWLRWIDNGWYEFVGVLYWIGPQKIWFVQSVNVLFASLASVFVARTGFLAYKDWRVGAGAALMVALFPSFVHFTSLATKDAVGLLAVSLFVWGLVSLRSNRPIAPAMLAIAAALLIYMTIRMYMVYALTFVGLLSLGPWDRVSRSAALWYGMIAVAMAGALMALWGIGFLGLDHEVARSYYDLDYINLTRERLSRGSGAIEADAWGQSLFADISNLALGLYYFFFSINILDVENLRQLSALPEMLVFLAAMPVLVRGMWATLVRRRHIALPILLVGVTVMAIYSSATTNMGALFRWRMQAIPFFILVAVYGASLRPDSLIWSLNNLLCGWLLPRRVGAQRRAERHPQRMAREGSRP